MKRSDTDFLNPIRATLDLEAGEGKEASEVKKEVGNAARHVAALGLSKSADGLIDPKLVLSWLLTSLGAPAWMLGLLVPIRESGALLPQLLTAGYLARLPLRKWVWAFGAAVQGLSAIAIGLAGLFLQGQMAGTVILIALSVLAIARSICSVSYKDVLGKTVRKGRRGRVTGLAGSLSAGVVIVYAVLLSMGLIARMPLVLTGLFLAGMAWLFGSLIFTTLNEDRGEKGEKANLLSEALNSLSALRTDPQLRIFIITRALLTGTALAPPFMVAAAAETGSGGAYEGLGFLVLASALAGLVSSFVWGRLSDHSSRKVLVFSGGLACLSLVATLILLANGLLSAPFVLPVVLFILMIAYQGVRLGRSTHLVDMADEDLRASYTAISNTVLGIVLIAGGLFSALAAVAGVFWVLTLMALMCAAAMFTGWRLEEVQRT